ncbi:MAG: hypothetical protein MJE77_25400 [Proteobacteria bacterium]|nr:hypothetical protein [Pseudomonadota bacterium]
MSLTSKRYLCLAHAASTCLAVGVTLAFAACSGPAGSPADPDAGSDNATLLIDPNQWLPTPLDHDVLAGHRPEAIECSALAWYREGGGMEVDTKLCNYFSLSQPLAIDLHAGDVVEVTVWWAKLASVAPAEGHLAVLFDDEVIWQEYVAIPGPADVRDARVTLSRDVAAGAPVTLHLHNHGYNTWRFQDLSIVPGHAIHSMESGVEE